MHICIVCHSYGIPVMLVNFEGGENLVNGDGVKYLDYGLGVGIKDFKPRVISRNLYDYDFKNLVEEFHVEKSIIDKLEKGIKSLNKEFF